MQLELGNIIESVLMYGVVVSKQDPNHTVLLSLDINFASGACDYRCVDKRYPFVELIEMDQFV